MRTIIYVDGFNLYFGSLKGTPHKWLNPIALARCHLEPNNQIVGLKYFTARLNPRPGDPLAPIRQAVYLRALQTLPSTEIIYGHFLSKPRTLPLASPLSGASPFATVIHTEEKGSDVNLAVQMLHDAHLNRFDCAVIISGDSDLLAPVKIVRHELRKIVGVLNPQQRPTNVLRGNASFYKKIKSQYVAASQFPDSLTDDHGTFTKPATW